MSDDAAAALQSQTRKSSSPYKRQIFAIEMNLQFTINNTGQRYKFIICSRAAGPES